jgi:hypothetical protein
MPVTIAGENAGSIDADRAPDQCPICNMKVRPNPLYVANGGHVYNATVSVVFHCPNSECGELFIAYFTRQDGGGPVCRLMTTRPVEPVAADVAEPVGDMSPNFYQIYNEAHKAEHFGLMQICGVGYRKALEFLVKDYLIKLRPNDQAAIESGALGQCINNYVTDPHIKQVAERAAWLGNDETHYKRLWIDKDVTDLKRLLSLVMHWIVAEHLTAEAIKSMPKRP